MRERTPRGTQGRFGLAVDGRRENRLGGFVIVPLGQTQGVGKLGNIFLPTPELRTLGHRSYSCISAGDTRSSARSQYRDGPRPQCVHAEPMAALGALDEVRRQLLTRGFESDPNELRLAGRLSCVSPHLRDRNKQRVHGLLSSVDPSHLTYTGLAAVWEFAAKAFLILVPVRTWEIDRPIAQWDGARIHATPGKVSLLFEYYDVPAVKTNNSLQALSAVNSLQRLNLRTILFPHSVYVGLLGWSTSLTHLNLAYCSNTADADLVWLARCTTLLALDLTSCNHVSDTGVVALAASCTDLQSLLLTYCGKVTDHSLTALRACTALTSLNIAGCPLVTEAAVGLLGVALPNVTVSKTTEFPRIAVSVQYATDEEEMRMMLDGDESGDY